jgi:hypothetical protein
MTEATAAALPQAQIATEARIPHRFIRPLGEQIIIRTIPQSEVGSILIPDSAEEFYDYDKIAAEKQQQEQK